MKTIGEFARKPELIKIELDSEDIQREFGDSVVFYMKDFVDISTYFDFFQAQAESSDQLSVILQRLILTEDGLPALTPDRQLPASLAIAALTRINETLGKFGTKSLMKQDGIQPA